MTKTKAGLIGRFLAAVGWITYVSWWFTSLSTDDKESLPANGLEQGLSFQICPLVVLMVIGYYCGTRLFVWRNDKSE